MSSDTDPPGIASMAAFQLRVTQRWVHGAVSALVEEDWLRVPPGTRNPPHWLLGHIAVSADIGPGLAPVDPLVPDAWEHLFGQGTHPDPEGVGYPLPSRLAETASAALERAINLVPRIPPGDLLRSPLAAVPAGMESFLRTRERLLGFSVLHLAYHIGQVRLAHRAFHPDAPGL